MVKKMQNFSCGVKHNFDSGVIIKNDDRQRYEWNCSTCQIKGKIITRKDLKKFKTSGRVICPLLTYE